MPVIVARFGTLAPGGISSSRSAGRFSDRLAEGPVLGIQQGDVTSPLGRRERVEHDEPVRPLERETPAGVASEPPAHGVLPVGGVDHVLGDRVPISSAAARTPAPGEAPDRTLEVRAVPGLPLVALVEDPEEEGDLGCQYWWCKSSVSDSWVPHGASDTIVAKEPADARIAGRTRPRRNLTGPHATALSLSLLRDGRYGPACYGTRREEARQRHEGHGRLRG